MVTKKQLFKFTQRWALPIAIILLPGGFVILALKWAYGAVLIKTKLPATQANFVATSAPAHGENVFFDALLAHNLHPHVEISGACIRSRCRGRHPAAAATATIELPTQKAAA